MARIKAVAAAVALAAAAAGPVRGETMIEMPLAEMVRAADLVVHGRVTEIKSRWGDEKRSVIWTDHVVRIEEVLHGKAPGDTVVVTQQGGALDGVVLQVGSNPDLRAGDEVVLMLARADHLKGMARGDARPKFTIVGVAQGTYYVVREAGAQVAFKNYARLAIVPRPDRRPTGEQPPIDTFVNAEVKRLREALKRNPKDVELARRLAEAERLASSAPPSPKRKPEAEGGAPRKPVDLGSMPPAPRSAEGGEGEGDVPAGLAEREQALKAAVEKQSERFQRAAEPVLLDELKQRIRQAGPQAKP